MKREILALTLVVVTLCVSTTIALASDAVQTVSVVPGSGAGLQSDDGMVHVQIPPDASPFGFDLRYSPNPGSTYTVRPPDAILLPYGFYLDFPTGGENYITQLDVPGTMVLKYNLSDLGGRSEATIKLLRLPDNYSTWFEVPGTLDTVAHTFTAQFTLPGNYALSASNFAPAPAPAPTAVPAPTQVPVPAAPPATAPAPAPAPAAPVSSFVAGRVFYDKNGNGIMDGSDFPVGGAGVMITSGSWEAFTRTNADGYYVFWDLGQGNYTVNLVVGTEWAYTTPNVVNGLGVSGQPGSFGLASFGIWYKLPQ